MMFQLVKNILSLIILKKWRGYKDVLDHLTLRTINSMVTSPQNWKLLTKVHSFSIKALSVKLGLINKL